MSSYVTTKKPQNNYCCLELLQEKKKLPNFNFFNLHEISLHNLAKLDKFSISVLARQYGLHIEISSCTHIHSLFFISGLLDPFLTLVNYSKHSFLTCFKLHDEYLIWSPPLTLNAGLDGDQGFVVHPCTYLILTSNITILILCNIFLYIRCDFHFQHFCFSNWFHGLTRKFHSIYFIKLHLLREKRRRLIKNTSCKNHLITINAMALDSV